MHTTSQPESLDATDVGECGTVGERCRNSHHCHVATPHETPHGGGLID